MNQLNKMEMNCKGCHKSVTYESYENHLKSCDAESTVTCPLECGHPDEMSYQDCKQHITFQCPKAESVCKIC